jgi:hypothetical protein
MKTPRFFPSMCLRTQWPVRVAIAVTAVLILITGGCSVVKKGTETTTSMLESLTGKDKGADLTNAVVVLQSEVMREADEYVGAVAQATTDFHARVPTIEARDAAQQWKLLEATAAYINATGENPVLNAVDMVVLASMSRIVMEDYWVGKKFGDAALPLLETHRHLETNAWKIVEKVLTPAQRDEVNKMIANFRRRFPEMRFVGAARFPELAAKLEKVGTVEEGKKGGNLLSMFDINPLAGLDPATQAIEQTRLLAQRITYYAQRAPMLLSWQVEMTTYQLAAQPEAQTVLSNLTDVAQSTTVFAGTAKELPKLVHDEREAAINQFFDRFAIERTNLLADLSQEETKLRGLLNETRQALGAGNDMAKSVNTAIQSLDTFVRYVSPPETNTAPAAPDTNSHPFNILDYGEAATRIGAMATNLTTMIFAANQSEAQVARLSRQATADAKEVIRYAFRLGAMLILLAGVIAGGLLWIHRRTLPALPNNNS